MPLEAPGLLSGTALALAAWMHDDTHQHSEILEDDPAPDQRYALAGGGRGVSVLEPADTAVETERAETVSGRPQDGSHVSAWHFHSGREPSEVPIERLPDLVEDDENLVWIDLAAYSPDELQEIGRLLSLDEIGITSALNAWQRPRVDVFCDGFLVTVTVPRLRKGELRVQATQLDLFVGPNYLVSAHKQPLPFEERVRARAWHNPDLVRLDSAFMLYIVLDELLEHGERVKERVQADIERMDQRALTETSDDFLEDLLQLKRYAFALSQLVDQHYPVFQAFVRPDFKHVSGAETEAYFRALDGRLSRLSADLHAARDGVNGSFNIYVSHVSHLTNNVMKTLTIVSTLLLPMSVILVFFGTSFHGVPIYTQHSFAIMLATLAVVVFATLGAFKWKGWF